MYSLKSGGHRADRSAKATNDQLQAALAYVSMIDSEAFESFARAVRLIIEQRAKITWP